MKKLIASIAVVIVLLSSTGVSGAAGGKQASDACWDAAVIFDDLIRDLNIWVECVPTTESEPWAGLFFWPANRIWVGQTTDWLYARDVWAHEIGHSWDYVILSHGNNREQFANIAGLIPPPDLASLSPHNEMWDGEWAADVFAYCIGFYRRYGSGDLWRTAGPMPTADVCRQLNNRGLVPDPYVSGWAGASANG